MATRKGRTSLAGRAAAAAAVLKDAPANSAEDVISEEQIKKTEANIRLLQERALQRMGKSFILKDAANIKGKDGRGIYKTYPQIGGEAFKAHSVYQSPATGAIIWVFKPAAVEQYIFMEMFEDEAKMKLAGFEDALKEAALDPQLAEMIEYLNMEKKKRDSLSKEDVYQDFGSW